MARNNSVEDSYNPPPIGSEFEEFNFEDIELDDLVWITDKSINGMENPAHRNLNEISALNLQTGNVMNFHPRQKVYQKT